MKETKSAEEILEQEELEFQNRLTPVIDKIIALHDAFLAAFPDREDEGDHDLKLSIRAGITDFVRELKKEWREDSKEAGIEQGSWLVEVERLVRGEEAIKRGDNNVWVIGQHLMEGRDFYAERSTKGYEVAFPLLNSNNHIDLKKKFMKMYETPTGALMSENDYQYLSDTQKAQCKIYIPPPINLDFNSLLNSEKNPEVFDKTTEASSTNADQIESELVEELMHKFEAIGIDTSKWEYNFGDGNSAAEFIQAGIKDHLEKLEANTKTPSIYPSQIFDCIKRQIKWHENHLSDENFVLSENRRNYYQGRLDMLEEIKEYLDENPDPVEVKSDAVCHQCGIPVMNPIMGAQCMNDDCPTNKRNK